jgi:hypothetical protein
MNARSVITALAVCVVAGCGATATSGETTPPSAGAPTTTSTTSTVPAATPTSSGSASRVHARQSPSQLTATTLPTVTKLLVVVVENHSMAQMARSMPYTFSLAKRYGYADHYSAIRHPSLPNYLTIASGSTHGVTDDRSPSAHPLSGPSVFGAALANKRTAAVYADAMTSPCQTSNAGAYVVRHNPWAYFIDERAACRSFDQPLAVFDTAARNGTLPNAGMLLPDLCHDAHDCSLSTADAWFHARMRTIMAGPDWRAGRLAVVLTADEDDRTAGNRVLTVVAHPTLSHVVVRTPMTHYSLTRLYAEVTHAPKLGNAVRAPSMARAFGLRTS